MVRLIQKKGGELIEAISDFIGIFVINLGRILQLKKVPKNKHQKISIYQTIFVLIFVNFLFIFSIFLESLTILCYKSLGIGIIIFNITIFTYAATIKGILRWFSKKRSPSFFLLFGGFTFHFIYISAKKIFIIPIIIFPLLSTTLVVFLIHRNTRVTISNHLFLKLLTILIGIVSLSTATFLFKIIEYSSRMLSLSWLITELKKDDNIQFFLNLLK